MAGPRCIEITLPERVRRLMDALNVKVLRKVGTDDDDDADAFCLAIVMNDLEAAIAHSDEANLGALPQIMHWLRHHAPRGSLGEAGRAWAAAGIISGLTGQH